MCSQSCTTVTTIYFQKIFITPKRNPLAVILHPFLPSSHWQPLTYFLSLDLPILDISYTWAHTICGLWAWLHALSILSSFTRGPRSSTSPFYGQIVFHCIDILLLFYSFVSGWTIGLFCFLAIMNNIVNEPSCTSFCVDIYFYFSWVYP